MRTLHPLTPDRVGDLHAPCAPCAFWQTGPQDDRETTSDAGDALRAWVERVGAEWGPPGRVLYVDDEPAGHVVLAPARLVPRLATFATAPSDPASVVLVTASLGTNGQRRLLMQAAAKEALAHGARSIDVVAARPLAVGRHGCVLEAASLDRLGFRVERDHPTYPRLRLDLRTVVTIRDEAAAYVASRLARLPGLRPVPETRPDGVTRARRRHE